MTPKRTRGSYVDEVLSPRELQVARLAAQALTSSEIAGFLGLRLRTIETALARAMLKLGVADRSALGPVLRDIECGHSRIAPRSA